MNRYFNPRTPVGCDRDVSDDNTLQNISIHAPQWGATRARLRYVRRVQYFNPRTPVGCDASCWNRLTIIPNFNPRTPVGCDGRSPRPAVPFYISIHAPQWGATSLSRGHTSLPLFQSTHPSGVRRDASRVTSAWARISIHAPQWGATHIDTARRTI